jgi:hypothetical protein
MGIYSSGDIFGIRIYNFNDVDNINILFEKKYNEIMSHEKMREAYLLYTELNNSNKISLQFYTECSSTHDINNKKSFMMWYPLPLNVFLEKFGV